MTSVDRAPYEQAPGGPPPAQPTERRDTRYKKGQTGNPKGRPKKKKPAADAAAFIEVSHLPVQVGDEEMTVAKAFWLSLYKRGLAGDSKAYAALIRMQIATGMLKEQPAPQGAGPILILPGMSDDEEAWEREVAKHQAKYRGEVH